jgi:hypothetical protein
VLATDMPCLVLPAVTFGLQQAPVTLFQSLHLKPEACNASNSKVTCGQPVLNVKGDVLSAL